MMTTVESISKLAQRLISIKSTSENGSALREALNVVLRELKDFQIKYFKKNGVVSALVYNNSYTGKKDTFNVLLNGHLDVVPGKESQYSPQVRGNRLYGVGAMDMKSSVACLVYAFKNVANHVSYPLGLQIVTDEEIGGFNGTKYQIDEGIKSEFVIAGESSSLNIKNRMKGILWVKISTRGKSAHGAYPWKGTNAIVNMTNFIRTLMMKFPTPKKQNWVTTINVANIQTNNPATNKVPDNCSITLDIRFIPKDSEKIINSIKKLLPRGFKMEILMKEPSQFTPINNPYLQKLKKSIKNTIHKTPKIIYANGSSDARHFARVGCPGIEFGPTGKGLGSDNEWVDIKSLKAYYDILKLFLLSVDRK